MCYLIAKEFDKQGCIAVKTRHGKELSNMVNELNRAVSGKGIQLVINKQTVSILVSTNHMRCSMILTSSRIG